MSKSSYFNLYQSGELAIRAAAAYEHLSVCDVCPLKCPVDRTAGEMGACKTGVRALVSSYGPHLGEEDPLRGARGSGTIFFSCCNLRCQYCQNHTISQASSGYKVEANELARIMIDLQTRGSHNINFVSPSHVVPQILAALVIAAEGGLRIPLVYNTGGYDSMRMLELLDGVIDIYMPDMKYADPKLAHRYSKIPNYPRINQACIKEMHRQVGDLQMDIRGIATRGLLVRHLVLPGNLAGTERIIRFLSEKISKNTYLNLMAQYHPDYKAHRIPGLDRRISEEEYQQALQWAHDAGMTRLDEKRPYHMYF
jgi:putative pyruvate formate lyase activating enzyme